jgi:hypothetical protein
MSITLGPIDRFILCGKGAEYVIGVVFDNIIVDTGSLVAALRARFNINIRHVSSPSDRWPLFSWPDYSCHAPDVFLADLPGFLPHIAQRRIRPEFRDRLRQVPVHSVAALLPDFS